VTPRDLEQALSSWVGLQPKIISLEPNDLDDVWNDFRRVGAALNVTARAEELVASLTHRLGAIRQRAAELEVRPRVAAIEWLGPLMAGGNWMPELIEIAGGRSLFAKAGEHSPWLDWATLIEADPDIILLLPCGFKIEQTRADLNLLTENPAWANLAAVRRGRVYLIDGHHFFNRPGPRLVESAEIVAEILHPNLFAFGHRGTGWIAMSDVK
jgi:iron complex transport system substrate-binding protein